jgi:hypothetical protein
MARRVIEEDLPHAAFHSAAALNDTPPMLERWRLPMRCDEAAIPSARGR